jgi:hypothetical protein
MLVGLWCSSRNFNMYCIAGGALFIYHLWMYWTEARSTSLGRRMCSCPSSKALSWQLKGIRKGRKVIMQNKLKTWAVAPNFCLFHSQHRTDIADSENAGGSVSVASICQFHLSQVKYNLDLCWHITTFRNQKKRESLFFFGVLPWLELNKINY